MISDISMLGITKLSPNLEHLEMQKCEKITEFGIKNVLENNKEIKYVDINKIPVVNYAFLDQLKKDYPDLMMRRNRYQDDDFKKDNMLRVPR